MLKKDDEEEFNKKDKIVCDQLKSYFTELHKSVLVFNENIKNDSIPYVRSQICLSFIAVDTFSRFYKILKNGVKKLNEDNEDRFKNWLNDFVFTEKNKIYKENKKKMKCDSGLVWKLRCSFVHFYSFPEVFKDGKRISFLFGNNSEKKRSELEKKFRKMNYKVVFINLSFLIDAIFEGILLQLEEILKISKSNSDEYIKFILNCYEIVNNEGVITIKIPE